MKNNYKKELYGEHFDLRDVSYIRIIKFDENPKNKNIDVIVHIGIKEHSIPICLVMTLLCANSINPKDFKGEKRKELDDFITAWYNA